LTLDLGILRLRLTFLLLESMAPQAIYLLESLAQGRSHYPI